MKDATRNGRGRRQAGNGHADGPPANPEAPARAAETRGDQYLADANRGTGGQGLADFLGFLSVGLGLAEVAAPGFVARMVGIRRPDATDLATVRLMGLRELTSGVAILSCEQPTTAVWSRVAGDALDVALLGKTLANPENDRTRTLLALVNVLAVSALDVMCATQLAAQPKTHAKNLAESGIVRVRRSITVGLPVEKVFDFWTRLDTLPLFMRHLVSVERTGERTSHWVARGPANTTFEWDAETLELVPNERIAWRSLPGADVFNCGAVDFRRAPGGRGTEVHAEIEYHPPLGKLGAKLAALWREEPRQQLADDLRRLKQVLEIGEVVVSDATKGRGPHPARPDAVLPRELSRPEIERATGGNAR